MKLVPDEKNLPRLHRIGTLVIVLLLVLLLAGLFAWQGWRVHREALHNIEQASQQQIQARLTSEMDSVRGAIDFTRSQTEAALRRSLVDQVDVAHGVAEGIHARESGRRPRSEVKQLILEALRPARFFDGRGYVFVNDMQGYIRLLPPKPELEGQSNRQNRDDWGQPVMGSLIEAARQPRGEGWARYRWYPSDDPRQMKDKLSYVRHFEPYDWLIGVGDYLHHWEGYQRREALSRLRATRFGRTGHVGVSTLDGVTLLTPSTPELEGKPMGELPELESESVERIIRLARDGGGFLNYGWRDPQSRQIMNKTALVRAYQPWGWVLVVAMLDDELMAPVKQELGQQRLLGREQAMGLLCVLLAAALLTLGGSWLFSRWSGRLFQAYHRRNLEQQQALRESEHRLNTILDSVDASIFIKGPDYRFLYANRKLCEELGLPLSAIVGREDRELLDPERARQVRQIDRRVFERGERVASEWVGELRGRSVALATVKLPLRDVSGGIYALCGVTTDVSERQRVEVVLAQARDVAEAANRAKSDFLSNVSHELRTPLNAILGMLHLTAQTPLSPQQTDYLRQVQLASRQLHGIIIDMLDYASLDSGRLELQSGDFVLGELLDQLAQRLAGEAATKDLGFTLAVDAGVPVQLVGDPQRLSQALHHYLANAIKFTEQGAVGLRVRLLQRDVDRVRLRFEVSDTGIGIDEARRQRLFQHLEQGDASSTRRYGGAGLGLVLVKQLAELMGGEAGCDSQPGRGSTFWFTACLGQTSHPVAAREEAAAYRWPHAAAPAAPAVEPVAGVAPMGVPDDPAWSALRERLLSLLRHDDVDSLQLFEQQEDLLRAALGERHRALAQAMRSYDFPAALALLEQS
ncbi:cache domain-containing protein [Malikia sp.]|uniref:cache domain-containing protein n=1 Tax=Malikia sp. TaxID=2070706 RepID=UPI0026319332|nr:cache domain-containing protein [Malikia sp.]MDD2728466.1 cache domain-containing protein [Malikia sp.]